MRNSEVVRLVESVNNVLHNNKISDEEIDQIQRWAQMGVDETGGTAYRIVVILTEQLMSSRDGLLKLLKTASPEAVNAAVEAKEEELAAANTQTGLSVGQPVRTIGEVDDDGVDDEPLGESEEELAEVEGSYLAGYR